MKRRLFAVLAVSFCLIFSACDSNNIIEKKIYVVDEKEMTEEEYKEYLQEQEKLNKELSESEKIAVFLIQQLMDNLKNPHSIEIYSIKYKKSLDFYYKVEFSATNNVGGRIEYTIYYEVSPSILSEDEDEVFLALYELKSGKLSLDYDKKGGEETVVDIDRIMNNIDTVIVEINEEKYFNEHITIQSD